MMYKIHEKYAILRSNRYRYFFVAGGRGSGKSFAIADFVVNLSYEAGHVILFTRYTLKSTEISIIPEFKDKILKQGLASDFRITKDEIINIRSGSIILFRGIKTSEGIQTAQLKSIPNLTTWILDEAEEIPNEDIFNTIDESVRSTLNTNRVIFVLNPSKITHWIYKRFYSQLPQCFTGIYEGRVYIHSDFKENATRLSRSFLQKAADTKAMNITKYNHRYLGYWLKETESALWTYEDITYKHETDFVRILISIDPATTAKDQSDETGIIVVGKNAKGEGFVIDDFSGKYKPDEWARKALFAYEKYKADGILVETNQGGDMVSTVIRQFDKNVKIFTVIASRGKRLRAEPISALYAEKKVFHVKPLVYLEEQMTSWDFDKGEKSPDRIDAMVHGLTKLMLTKSLVAV